MPDSHFPASKRTIMVVDDNADLVEIVRLTLESKGFNVKCAYSGKDLFAGLEEQKPDLIILDIMLEVLVQLKCNPATGGFYLSYDVKHWAHTELLPAWEVFSHLIEINKIRPKLKDLL